MAFLMIEGDGDPNTAASYREAIETLFAVAYTVKPIVKRGPSATDFAVMPREASRERSVLCHAKPPSSPGAGAGDRRLA